MVRKRDRLPFDLKFLRAGPFRMDSVFENCEVAWDQYDAGHFLDSPKIWGGD